MSWLLGWLAMSVGFAVGFFARGLFDRPPPRHPRQGDWKRFFSEPGVDEDGHEVRRQQDQRQGYVECPEMKQAIREDEVLR